MAGGVGELSAQRVAGVLRGRAAHLETQQARFRGLAEEQLYTALETILERAPSALIEEVARKLTQWAGKFGEEK